MILGDQFARPLVECAEGIRIHPMAEIHPTADLGPGTVVWAGAVIGAGVVTGSHCAIGSGTYIGTGSRLGESVRIQHGVFLPNRSQLGDRVIIGPNATFTDDRRPRVNNPQYRAEPPVIESDVGIGAGAVILPGITLGQGCLIGAGAVVTHDVASYAVVVGSPAGPIRKRSPEPHPLTGELMHAVGG